VCSLCVHCVFTVCSLCVHCVFTVCSLCSLISCKCLFPLAGAEKCSALFPSIPPRNTCTRICSRAAAVRTHLHVPLLPRVPLEVGQPDRDLIFKCHVNLMCIFWYSFSVLHPFDINILRIILEIWLRQHDMLRKNILHVTSKLYDRG